MAGNGSKSQLLKLHLGCGSTVVPGWMNIDKSPTAYLSHLPRIRRVLIRVGVLTHDQATAALPAGIVHHDVVKGLPCGPGAAGYVYSSHMIGSLTRGQTLRLLRECHRALTAGGVIRLATPDLAELLEAYRNGDTSHGPTPADSLAKQLFADQDRPLTPAQLTLRRLLSPTRRWIYDEASLSFALAEAGFTNIRRRGFREGSVPDLELLETRPNSLFVEAVRP